MTGPIPDQVSPDQVSPDQVSPDQVSPDQVRTSEIAGLLAWARSLCEAGRAADPAELAAYQAAKTALLARITDQPTAHPPQGTDRD